MELSGTVRDTLASRWAHGCSWRPLISGIGPQLALIILLLSLPACRGTRSLDEGWKPSRPIDFTYEMGGKQTKLSRLRGRPLVLVLMRTSELPSQAYMKEVSQAFTKIAGVVRFLVLTIEQMEAPFVGPYAEAEQLPFPIGVAEPDVGNGLSPLGLIPTTPTTYLIDSKGRVYDAAAGLVKSDQLIEAIQHVDKR